MDGSVRPHAPARMNRRQVSPFIIEAFGNATEGFDLLSARTARSRHIKSTSIDTGKWVSNWSLDRVVMAGGIRRYTQVSD
jgi:hypothetical protein